LDQVRRSSELEIFILYLEDFLEKRRLVGFRSSLLFMISPIILNISPLLFKIFPLLFNISPLLFWNFDLLL